VLTYGSEVFVKGQHQVPDPDLMTYRYIAEPLAEMSPDFRHPANGLTIQEILDKITDKAQIKKLDEVENGIEG
jgi:7,8-dihydro-6-hydroxymethylpterin-pyrophosphokinase